MLLKNYEKKRFDKVLRVRYDRLAVCYYFSCTDCAKIKSENYDIQGDKGVNLRGYFYYYDKMDKSRIVIFEHGIAAGHNAYFKEIMKLARHGYTVYAYDHTGCGESGGDNIVGFSQSLNDLDHVVSALKSDPQFKDTTYSVVGHSWGGFSTLNISAIHPDITHLVVLAGFLSPKVVIKQNLKGIHAMYRDYIFSIEKELNPRYCEFDARESLMKSSSKLLAIYSDDDKLVKYRENFIPLKKALKDRENTTLITVHNKNHNPQYSAEGVKYLEKFNQSFFKLSKKKKLKTKEQQDYFKKQQNWQKITEQDEDVWNMIFNFLDN